MPVQSRLASDRRCATVFAIMLLLIGCESNAGPATQDVTRLSGMAQPSRIPFPDSTTTGTHGALTVFSGPPVFRTANAVIENVEIRASSVQVAADNITFRNVKFVYTGGVDESFTMIGIYPTVRGTRFEDCEIDGQNQTARAITGPSDVEVRRCDIHNTGNGVEVQNSFVVEDSYLHDIYTPPGLNWHADGIQARDASVNDITIRRNTILLTGPETGAIHIIGKADSTSENIVVEDNLLGGGSYTVYAGAGTVRNFRVINNSFTTRIYPKVGKWGIWYPMWKNFTATGNRIFENGAPADPTP